MILPTEKSAWGIPFAGSKQKEKNVSAEGIVKDQTWAFLDAVNAVYLSGDLCAPKVETDSPQAGVIPAVDASKSSLEKPQSELSNKNINKNINENSFQSAIGKVNIFAGSPVVYQSRDLISIDKKNELRMDSQTQDEENAAALAEAIQKDSINQTTEGWTVLTSNLIHAASSEQNPEELLGTKPDQLPAGAQTQGKTDNKPQAKDIHDGSFRIIKDSKTDELQAKAENTVNLNLKNVRYVTNTGASKESGTVQRSAAAVEDLNQSTVKSTGFPGVPDIGSDAEKLLGTKPDQLPAGAQTQGKTDNKPQAKDIHDGSFRIIKDSKTDEPQAKAENPVNLNLKNVRYVTNAGASKESGTVQRSAAAVEDLNQSTVKSTGFPGVPDIGSDTEELLGSTPDQIPAGAQTQGKTDKLQAKDIYDGSSRTIKDGKADEPQAKDIYDGSSRIIKDSKMDEPQAKAENPVNLNLKNARYVINAGALKESGTVQSSAATVEELNQRTVKSTGFPGIPDTDSDHKEISKSTSDQSLTGIQRQVETDKLQSIVGDFNSLEVAPFGLNRRVISKFKTEQFSPGLTTQGSGTENNSKNNNTGHIESIRTDTWTPVVLETVESSTNYTPDKGSVVQSFAALKSTGRISAEENVRVPGGDEKIAGLQQQSDLLQNLAGSLSEAAGFPRNTAFKQESAGTYQQVSVAELPQIVLSALRSSGFGEKLVRINLIPENLGPLAVKVKEIKDKIVIHFITSSVDAKEVLEVSMPQLKQSISLLSGSANETLVFLSQGQGQGNNDHTQGGWCYFNNPFNQLLNDSVSDTRQLFENGLTSQDEARAVNYWI